LNTFLSEAYCLVFILSALQLMMQVDFPDGSIIDQAEEKK